MPPWGELLPLGPRGPNVFHGIAESHRTRNHVLFQSYTLYYLYIIQYMYIYVYCVSVSGTSMHFVLNFLMKSNSIPKILLLNTFPSHPRRVRGSPPKPRGDGVCDQRRWRVWTGRFWRPENSKHGMFPYRFHQKMWSESTKIPSGNLTYCSYWKWQFIVSFPINSMVIFHSYVNVYQRVETLSMSFAGWSAKLVIPPVPKNVPCQSPRDSGCWPPKVLKLEVPSANSLVSP